MFHRHKPSIAAFLCASDAFWVTPAPAHEGQSELIEELIVYGRAQQLIGIAGASSEGIVGAFNLLDSDDSDISYLFASRLDGEPAAGIEDVHFHPLEPRSVRASLTMNWN